MTIQARIRIVLDRPYLRWVLAPFATADVVRQRRELCLLLPSAGWVHRYRSGSIEWDSIGAPTPASLDRETRDVFLHRYVPKRGDVVVDVGAGVGEEVHTFSRLVGEEGRVIAVEAHPRAAELLRRNVRRWRLANVEIVAGALTDQAGTSRITDDGASVGNRLLATGGVEVPALTFDQLLTSSRIDKVNFLKMNIEGAELPALRAASRLSDVANAAVSCHDFLVEHGADPAVVATKARVTAILEGAGFDLARRPDDPRPWVRDYLYASRDS